MSELAMRLADGEQSAWTELYDSTSNSLYHYLTALTGEPNAAADVLQEVFVRLFRSRNRLREVTDLKSFVFTVTRNETNRWLKDRSKRMGPLQLDSESVWSFDESILEHSELVRYALGLVSQQEHEIVHLKIYGEFTFAQIAEILGLPVGTCASRYRRALTKIQATIQEQIG
jgi:RNA polymerase sigma-70 factor, ECF subfamily